MQKKHVSLDDLARMVNNGFEDMRKRMERVEKRVNTLPTRGELLNYATLQKQVSAVREYLKETFSANV